MKRFRNVLVQRYVEIDNTKVYDILRTRLGDFKDFKREVIDFLRRQEPKRA